MSDESVGRVPILSSNSDYNTWKLRIKSKLVAKGFPSDIFLSTGVTTISDNDSNAKRGITISRANAIIYAHVDDNILNDISSLDNPHLIIQHLDNIFLSKQTTRLVSLIDQLTYCKMNEGTNIRDHIRTFETLMKDLKEFKFMNEDYIPHLFLSSLPKSSSWLAFTTSIEAPLEKDTKLNLERVKTQAINHAMRMEGWNSSSSSSFSSSSSSSEIAFHSTRGSYSTSGSSHQSQSPQPNPPPSPSSPTSFCNVCKKKNHTEDKCFSKFPHLLEEFQKRNRHKKSNNNNKESSGVQPAFVAVSVCLTSALSFQSGWFLDSAASCHITPHREYLSNFKPCDPYSIKGGHNEVIATVVATGDITFSYSHNGSNHLIIITNVSYAPDFRFNILSVGQLKLRSVFFNSEFNILTSSKSLPPINVVQHGTLFLVSVIASSIPSISLSSVIDSSSSDNQNALISISPDTWHYRFGHANPRHLSVLLKSLGISFSPKKLTSPCLGCAKGKSTVKAIGSGPTNKSNTLFEWIHSDLCGPMSVSSVGGANYFTLFVEDKSGYAFIYLLKQKNDYAGALSRFVQMVDNQFASRIKHLHSDRGGEYVNKSVDDVLTKWGILHHKTPAHTSAYNGVAERRIRTIVTKARCMMQHSNTPISLWGEACIYATTLSNSLPSTSDLHIPHSIIYSSEPDISLFRVFGCQAQALIQDKNVGKFESRTKGVIYVGPSIDSAGYRLWDPSTKRITVNRNVTFFENSFGSVSSMNTVPISLAPSHATIDDEYSSDEEFYKPFESSDILSDSLNLPNVFSPLDDDDTPLADNRVRATSSASTSSNSVSQTNTSNFSSNSGHNPTQDTSSAPRRTSRVRGPTPYLAQNYVMFTREPEPVSHHQALKGVNGEKWRKAMDEEMESLRKNNTFALCPIPNGRKAIPTRWVFKVKYTPDGEVERYKARLVAKGFKQRHGEDYFETFAPVARMSSIRVIIAIAAAEGLDLEQIDVDSAFLNGIIDTEIYLDQPPGYKDLKCPDHVWRLLKGLYGLKQASRIWHAVARQAILTLGLQATSSDVCIFIGHWKEGVIIIGIHVDDFIIAGTPASIARFKLGMQSQFNIKLLGQAKFILGIQIRNEGESIFLSQETYIRQFIDEIMSGVNQSNGVILHDIYPLSLPIIPSYIQLAYQPAELLGKSDVALYRKIVGKVMYCMVGTRPDIAFATNFLGRFASAPTKHHLKIALGLIRYLHGSASLSLKYSRRKGPLELITYADSDWAGDLNDRKSTQGALHLLGGSPIAWESKKQTIVATSSTAAEYISLSSASKDVVWSRNLLSELGYTQEYPTVIFEDNMPAISLAEGSGDFKKTKHIDVQYHYIRERVEQGDIDIFHCPSINQMADIFTKASSKQQFLSVRDAILHP